MASNRSAIITKTHKILKKHFKPATLNQRLPLLEQLVYAACLEEASAEAADQALAALEEQFYDWNEVRVSTVTELAEAINMLPSSRAAAQRVKQTLQSVFEATYSFDLEQLKKENIGVAVKKLHSFRGITPFCVAFATQNALGGHSIPVGQGALEVLYCLGVVSEKERRSQTVPGLERAIPKNKGAEFGSLLNQLGVQFQRTPFGPAVRKIILEISPDAKERLPKRRSKKAAAAESAKEKKTKGKATATSKKKAAEARTAGKKSPTAKKTTIKKKVTVKKKKGAAGVKTKVKKKTKKAVVTKRVTRRKPR